MKVVLEFAILPHKWPLLTPPKNNLDMAIALQVYGYGYGYVYGLILKLLGEGQKAHI